MGLLQYNYTKTTASGRKKAQSDNSLTDNGKISLTRASIGV